MNREHGNRRRIVAIATGSAGNLIEWFDFYIYAYTALYFAPSIFPGDDRAAQLLNAAGIFAIGFLVRPLGGVIFGKLADQHGRRTALVASVLLMGVGSLLIALLPTYQQAGWWAAILLLLARLLQGLSTGGQFGAAATYLSEVAADDRRGFHASFLYVTIIAGQIGAVLLLVLLQQLIDETSLREWGWRIPFLVGAVLALAILLLRKQMLETLPAPAERAPDAGSIRALRHHKRELLVVVALTAGGGVCLYTFTTYMQKFLVITAGLPVSQVNGLMLAALTLFMILQPVMGWLSDRIGRRGNLLLFSGAMTLSAVPLLDALSVAASGMEALWLVGIALTILSLYTSVSGLFKAELFPQKVRALGVGLAHSVSIAVFGGTAEYVALLSRQAGVERAYFWYVALMSGVAFVTAYCMREPRRLSMAG